MREPEKPVKLTTQNMVPYSLLKKKQDAKRLAYVKKSSTQQGSDEESDEEPATFFFHLDSSTPPKGPPADVASTGNSMESTTKAIRLPGVCPMVTKPVLPTPMVEQMGTVVTTTSENNSTETMPTFGLQGTALFHTQPSQSRAHWDHPVISPDHRHPVVSPDHRQPEQPMDEEAVS